MAQPTPAMVRDYLAGLSLAGGYEIKERRNTPVETKLRQIRALMASAALLENAAQRESGVRETRERWARLCRALRA